METLSPALIVAVGIQLGCQAFKVAARSWERRRFEWRPFFHAGGMPSSHSAFVTALAVSIGLEHGLDSDLFAVTFVFAAIIVYDTFRLRGAVQHQTEALGRLTRLLPESERPRLPDRVGHTLPEIVVGCFVGGGLAYLAARAALL